jgi:hypothetical protein
VDLLLYRAPGQSSSAAMALHEYLAHYLGVLVDPRQALETQAPEIRAAARPVEARTTANEKNADASSVARRASSGNHEVRSTV